MGASLCVIEKLALKPGGAAHFKDLVPSLVSILKQILEHRLPTDYDYHRMPAPWMQMKIIRVLSIVGKGDQEASEGMYEMLAETMKRADTGINAGYAIQYECVKTITSIYPNATLLDAAAAAISRFLSSTNQNLKYLGITGLAAIVKDHPKYATQHQIAVIECLEDPDETLRAKTLDLLYRMTNANNVVFITAKLLAFLEKTNDAFLHAEFAQRVTQIAER
jgi:AP-4 complex subunit epsilon-1